MDAQIIDCRLRQQTCCHESEHQKPAGIVHAFGCLVPAVHRTVKPHDRGHGSVNLLRGLFLVRFDIACRVGADENIVHHPPKDRMPAVGNHLLQHQLHQFFGRRRHILEALPEREHRESHALKVLHHLHRAPPVKGNISFCRRLLLSRHALIAAKRMTVLQ